MPTLQIDHLSKKLAGKPILHDLDLQIESREIVSISGKSGTGKTTLLLLILGFLSPDQGEIVLDGQDLLALPIEQRSIAYMPQDYGLFPHLSVAGNILFGLTLRKVSAPDQKAKLNELIQVVELPVDVGDRHVDTLSGGEKQRVALARALAINPKLILMDEPLSAIDIETKKEVGSSLRKIIKKLGVPAIMITHDPVDAHQISDILYELKNGQLDQIWVSN